MKKATTDNKSVDEIINNHKKNKEQNITTEAKAVVAYINSKIEPHKIVSGEESLYELAELYDIETVLKAIDVSANTYLGVKGWDGYDESVDKFIEKIGGILYNWSHKND